jgi:hypothetical protein
MPSPEVPDSQSRNVLVVVAPDPEADAEEAERLAHQLRTELHKLDVESVTLLQSDEMPPGAKGEPLTIGQLLVTLGAGGGILTALIEMLRDWLGRHANVDRVAVTIDGDTLELDHATAQERRDLIATYVRRHATHA